MKIIYSKIFYNKINPDENFPDYGIYVCVVQGHQKLLHSGQAVTNTRPLIY